MKILQKENKALRNKAKPVSVEKIKSSEIQEVIKNMKKAMQTQDDAVGIAAPQIGVPLRIFVVSGKAFIEIKEGETDKEPAPLPPDMVFINPEIIKKSRKEVKVEEGCLSVRWWYGKVKRATKTTISAYDEHGKKFTRGASGLLAQIFQHEVDHLEGILFTDKATDLREAPPQEKTGSRIKS